jgi:hypothetical protein
LKGAEGLRKKGKTQSKQRIKMKTKLWRGIKKGYKRRKIFSGGK